MTYNEFVARPAVLRLRIDHKIEDVQYIEAICTKATTELEERVQTSPANRTEANYVRYAEARKELMRMVNELDRVSDEVRRFLYASLNVDQADLLEWRYVDCKSVEDIAERRNMTVQSARNKISRANRNARRAYLESGYKIL